jgi:hypothetical protein
MLTRLRDLLRRQQQEQEPVSPAPIEPDQRSDGEQAQATLDGQLREATTPGTPRLKTDNL